MKWVKITDTNRAYLFACFSEKLKLYMFFRLSWREKQFKQPQVDVNEWFFMELINYASETLQLPSILEDVAKADPLTGSFWFTARIPLSGKNKWILLGDVEKREIDNIWPDRRSLIASGRNVFTLNYDETLIQRWQVYRDTEDIRKKTMDYVPYEVCKHLNYSTLIMYIEQIVVISEVIWMKKLGLIRNIQEAYQIFGEVNAPFVNRGFNTFTYETLDPKLWNRCEFS